MIVSGKKLGGSRWSQTVATFRLDTDQNVKVSVLVDLWEFILREHIPNFGQVKFDMSESNATTLQKSEIVVGRIQVEQSVVLPDI